MRVIAGDYKGRNLESPRDNEIRPTTDKVKEAMFSILMPYLEDGVICDLFAGTGALGLEALSRGAAKCYFCDKDREALSIIRRNIKKCDADQISIVIQGDYMKCLHRLEGNLPDERIDVFILDPPYMEGLYDKALAAIDLLDLLEDEGIIIVEHPKGLELPETFGKLSKCKERLYGKTQLTLYEKTINQ